MNHTLEQSALDFLKKHVNADQIIMHRDTGMPVAAVYSGPDSTGNHRSGPAVFWFTTVDE